MPATITPTDDDVFTALKAFVVLIIGLSADNVVQGLGNLVSQPIGPYIALTALIDRRLSTNIDTWDETNPAPTTISAEQHLEASVQIDCYGPASHDWSRIISTLFRDDYAFTNLAPVCAPLHADEPIQIPLVDGEQQYEKRWLINAKLQVNPIVVTPMQFADTLEIDVINVDEAYPP